MCPHQVAHRRRLLRAPAIVTRLPSRQGWASRAGALRVQRGRSPPWTPTLIEPGLDCSPAQYNSDRSFSQFTWLPEPLVRPARPASPPLSEGPARSPSSSGRRSSASYARRAASPPTRSPRSHQVANRRPAEIVEDPLGDPCPLAGG